MGKKANMREWKVTLFVMGMPNPDTRVERIEAHSQEEAERKAHDRYISEGWGVLDSRPVFKPGDLVKWNDPGIDDYDPEDREWVKGRLFQILNICESEDEDYEGEDMIATIVQINGGSEAEVYESELELAEEVPIHIEAYVAKADVKYCEDILVEAGVSKDDAKGVLERIGLALLNTELYLNTKGIELHNKRN